MKQSIARKELSRTEENGIETIKNEIKRFDFDKGILFSISNIFDDWEYANDHGVNCDEESDIFMIDVNEVIEELQSRIDCDDTPDKEDSQREKDVIEYLKEYRDYIIWM